MDASARAPPWALAEAPDLPLLVCRPRLEELRLVLGPPGERIPARRVGLLLIVDRPYPVEEVRALLAERAAVDVVGPLAHDPRTAAALVDAGITPAALRRSPLVRSARDVAEQLNARLTSRGSRQAS